jgi:hypothetical protein
MTAKPDTPATPPPAEGTPAVAADLIEPVGAELTAGGKSPTAAADAADILASGGAGAGGGPDAPATPAPAIGRASERAKAGFNNKHSKRELIERGRELAKHARALEDRVAALEGKPVVEGEPGVSAVVAVDPAALEEPMAEVAGVVSDFLCAWRGEHWKFTPEERQKLGKASAPVIAELAPALGEHAGKLTLVLVVLGIAMPRLRQDRELAAAKPAA